MQLINAIWKLMPFIIFLQCPLSSYIHGKKTQKQYEVHSAMFMLNVNQYS